MASMATHAPTHSMRSSTPGVPGNPPAPGTLSAAGPADESGALHNENSHGRAADRASEPMVLGVASTIAANYGFSAAAVRSAFIILAAAGGFGVVMYVVALLIVQRLRPIPLAQGREGDAGINLVAFGLAWWLCTWWPGASLVVVFAVALVIAAWTVGFRPLDVSAGSDRTRQAPARAIVIRIVVGTLLLLLAGSSLMSAIGSVAAVSRVAIWIALAVVGLGLLAAPSVSALSNAHRAEYEARIRESERAAVAAHLHDSVLQTLTLIGRNAHDPVAIAKLARRQERDLRRWLYRSDQPGVDPVDSSVSALTDWSAALRRSADQIEDDYGVQIELVAVGRSDGSAAIEAACQAATEAMVNAAKFAGVDRVAVFAERSLQDFTVFVRDRGQGFEPASVDPSRRGIAESIIARAKRAGGIAEIHSTLGVGTEVSITVPITVPNNAPTAGPTAAPEPPGTSFAGSSATA